MDERAQGLVRRRPRGVVLRARRIFLYLFGRMWEAFQYGIGRDVRTIVRSWRLFFGVALVIVGVLSFASDMYCDGNTSAYAVCTRPSTYYYYPWWAVFLVVMGATSVLLWYMRKE